MHPQSAPAKPVMDVMAPSKQSRPIAPAGTQPELSAPDRLVSTQGNLTVAQAPATDSETSDTTKDSSKQISAQHTPPKKRNAGAHTPIALISITFFMMFLLIGLAIIMYLTSRGG